MTRMTLRTRHGTGREHGIEPMLETLPVDELPEGVPAEPDPARPPEKDAKGRFLPGNRSSSRGGKAKAGYRRIAADLGGIELPESSPLRPYRTWAREWRDSTAARFATKIGGGQVDDLSMSILDSAAHCLMWSRYLNDQAMLTADRDLAQEATKQAVEASRLARQAWEYCAKGATDPDDDEAATLAAAQVEFQRRLAAGEN